MHEIVVLSGKGGTGKTSITAALASIMGNTGVIADCDVDAANMHLLLKPDFAEKNEFFSGEIAVINQSACSLCGNCLQVCHFDAISFDDYKFFINPLDCEGCDYCRKICPENAIDLIPRKSGNLFVSGVKTNTSMIHARLDIGADNSGKLVAEVKKRARDLALSMKLNFILIDGSPGTGCPVVSALSGASYVVLVTEPTKSGLHDLKRVFEVINRQKLVCGCIINKADLNAEMHDEILNFLQSNHIAHLENFHFDVQFNQAMLNEETIVEFDASYFQRFHSLWSNIINTLNF